MVVDWLQTCYESDFCVDASTGETIRGRYYFTDPGADVFPIPHYFSSGVFLDEVSRPFGTYLGDQRTNVTEDDGSQPLVRPFTRRRDVAISPACAGERVRLALTADTFQGMPRRCFATTLNACSSYEAATDPNRIETWRFACEVIKRLYLSDPDVADFVRDYLPGSVEVEVREYASPLPPKALFWRAACGRGLIMSGTENFQQMSMQALYSSHGPVAVPEGFNTSRFWYDMAKFLQLELTEFAPDASKRTFLSGHSYGGAIASLIDAFESTPQTKGRYDLVTLGAPRLGDSRLYQRLALDRCRFIQNEGDPVPSMPPAYPTMTDFFPIIGPLTFFFWQRWAPPPVQTVVREDGTTYLSSGFNAAPVTATIIANVIASFAIMPAFTEHFIATYEARLNGT